MNTIEQFNEHVIGSYGRYDVVMEKGEGRTAVDENGKEYIDFGSGIGVNSLGFCDEKWVEAVCSQVRTLQHTSNYYYTRVQSDFAKKLCEMTGYSKMFFGNSGAEANECAIKIARKYSFDKYGKGRNRIITLVNSFHGRTVNTLSATGQEVFHNYFFPFVEGYVNVAANDIDDLMAKLDDSVCAVMIEFVQGEGGVVPLEKSFVDKIFEVCPKRDILIIADEVQTGAGRTGRMLASHNYGVKPNITTLAKGVAGGLPIGICLADEKCEGVLTPGTHGSTFGGNPICCAGGLAVLDRLSEKNAFEEIAEKGDYIKKKLLEIEEVEGVDGLGMMIGIRLKTKKAGELCKACLENGLLVLTAKEKLRLLPPLTISYEEIDKGMEILRNLMK